MDLELKFFTLITVVLGFRDLNDVEGLFLLFFSFCAYIRKLHDFCLPYTFNSRLDVVYSICICSNYR